MNEFKDLLDQFSMINIKENTQLEPSMVSYKNEESGKKSFFNMNNRVLDYNHNECLELNKTLSKKLYESYPEIWCKIIKERHMEHDDAFYRTRFVKFKSTLIDYVKEDITNEYIRSLVNHISDDIDNNGYLVSASENLSGDILVQLSDPDSVAVMIVTLNLNKGYYSIHQGRYDMNGCIKLFSKPSFDTFSFIEFIESLDSIKFSEQFEILNSLVEELDNSTYDLDIELSYRELLDFIKYSKIDVQEDGNGIACDLNNLILRDDNCKAIKSEIIKSLSICPYKSLKKMNWFAKSLKKTDKVTVKDLLIIFSDNLLNPNCGITPFLLVDLFNVSANMNSDDKIKENYLKENK